MKKKWMLLGIAAVLFTAGMGWFVLKRDAGNGNSAVPCSKFCGYERSEEEQEFLDAVLESPEVLDGAAGQAGRPRYEVTLPVGKERHLLSDVQKPLAPQPLAEPVAADSLSFRTDYASLRTDAVRNPNSPENRAGVVSLMTARQRRLGRSNIEQGAGE